MDGGGRTGYKVPSDWKVLKKIPDALKRWPSLDFPDSCNSIEYQFCYLHCQFISLSVISSDDIS